MSDTHTSSTWIKPTCICMLSSWSEIYSRIKLKKKKVQKPYMQLGLLMSEKCGIFIANSICIQYADLQILDSLPKSLLSELADSLHFPDEPEGTCWWAGDKVEYFAKTSDHGFMVGAMQCHLASPRGAGTSLQHGVFLTGVGAQIPGRCQHRCDELCWCGCTPANWSRVRYLRTQLWWVL